MRLLDLEINISGFNMRFLIGVSMILMAIVITVIVAYIFFKDFNDLDEGGENEL